MIKARNNEIKAEKVLLIDFKGNNLGEMTKETAMIMAEECDLDLLMVQEGDVPVCKLMDYSKMEYEKKKKQKTTNKKSHKQKEIRMKTNIGEHDIQTKVSHAEKFLSSGNEVKISIRVIRRYGDDKDFAKNFMNDFINKINVKNKIKQGPEFQGGFYNAILIPA